MTLLFKNNATSRLALAAASGDTSITVQPGEGARFPAITTPVTDYFQLTLEDRRTNQIEVCRCTNRVGDVLTLVRGQEGTVAQAFAIGAVASNRFTAGTLQEILDRDVYTKVEADARFINTAGDTMTGALTVLAPTAGGHAATKTYVDNRTPITVDAPNDANLYGRQGGTWVRALPFTAYTAADILAKLLTVDGAGSGLDADLLDGNSSAFFAPQASLDATNINVTDVTTRVTTLETTMPTKAPLASPVFTGDPRAPTPVATDNDTTIATTAFVQTGLSGKIGDAPNDGQYYQRRNNNWEVGPGGLTDAPVDGKSYGRKDALWAEVAPIASPALTGVPTAPTAAAATNTTQIATTAFVKSLAYAPLASPALTGVPTAPTASAGTNTTQIATTAFVQSGYLPITGGVLTGALTISAGNLVVSAGNLTLSNGNPTFINTAAPSVVQFRSTASHVQLFLDCASSGFANQIYGRSNLVFRWLLELGNTTAETGANAGSDFRIIRYSDAGASLGNALIIARSTGFATFGAGASFAAAVNVTGGFSATGNIDSTGTITAAGTLVAGTHFMSSGTAAVLSTSGGAGGYVYLRPRAYNDTTGQLTVNPSGAVNIQSTLTVAAGGLTVSAGGASITGAVTISSTLDVNSTIQFQSTIFSATATVILATTGAGNIYLRPNGSGSPTGQFIVGAAGDTTLATDANLVLSGTGGYVQAGGGIRSKAGQSGAYTTNFMNLEYRAGVGSFLWVNTAQQGQFAFTSDYRIKKNIEPLPSMWDVVKRMRPIKYTNGTWDEYPEMYFSSDDERWGFIAHELQEDLLPTASSGYKDEPNALQTPNPLTILSVLCKALQEAIARIEALEGGAA